MGFRAIRLVAVIVGALAFVVCYSQAQDAVGSQPSAPLKVGGKVSAPVPIQAPNPEYTRKARKANIQGTVILAIVVKRDGTVGDVRVQRSLDPGLDEKAIATVKRWRFNPAQRDGTPVDVEIRIEVNFRLLGRNQSLAPTATSASLGPRIDTASDGPRVVELPIAIRITLPVGWTQIAYHEATYSRPSSVLLNRSQTFAYVQLVRQPVEASPSLFRKMFEAGMEQTSQNFDITGEEAVNKPEWNGTRLFVLATRSDVRLRHIIEIYTRDKEHYIVDAYAPDEVFANYRQDFIAMMKSIEFTSLPASLGSSSAQPNMPSSK
jgi:TonB family protein